MMEFQIFLSKKKNVLTIPKKNLLGVIIYLKKQGDFLNQLEPGQVYVS